GKGICESCNESQQLRDAVRSLCAYEADAVSVALYARRKVRRQHGASDVQHGAGGDAAGAGWARFLLLGLSLASDGRGFCKCCARLWRQASLFGEPVAVLFGDAAAGGFGLLGQRIFS